jgi:hypothetical protein
MRSFTSFALACLCCTLGYLPPVRAQTPPAQDYVNAIGASPLKAPATADFAPGSFFTMEGWLGIAKRVQNIVDDLLVEGGAIRETGERVPAEELADKSAFP